MRFLLVQPPIRDFYRTEFREYPLGLLYIAAFLKQNGHTAVILDARKCPKPKSHPVPDELRDLEKYYTKENKLFSGYKHFGMGPDEIKEAAKTTRPDHIFISSMFTPYLNEVIETAKTLREALPGIPITAGGHHATADPDSLLASHAIDNVFLGEGEEFFSGKNGVCRVGDLDTLPFPARELLPPDHSHYFKRRYTMILTSRGCPHRCSFCSVHHLSGHQHRRHSLERVTAEIEECLRRFGFRVIDFQDDNLLMGGDRFKTILEEIIRRHDTSEIEFLASNGLNASSMDKELLQLMKRAGFKKLDLALATSDVPYRKKLYRPETIGQYEEILDDAVKLGFHVTTYIILGFPTQPLGEMKASIEYLKLKPTLISPSIFYNVPGMPIFDEMKKYEYHSSHPARRSSAFNNFGEDFTRDDLFMLFKEILQFNRARRVGHFFSGDLT